MTTTTKVKASFPFLSILCLMFIALKLTGYIAWSWWWVLSPILIPWGIVGALCLFMGILLLIEHAGTKK